MPYKHVTSLMVLRKGDNITMHVLNFGTTLESTRIRIFANRAAALLTDSGDKKIPPRGTTAISYALLDPEVCWVEIDASAETLIPMCYFLRPAVPTSEVLALVRGAEFAVFDSAGQRQW